MRENVELGVRGTIYSNVLSIFLKYKIKNKNSSLTIYFPSYSGFFCFTLQKKWIRKSLVTEWLFVIHGKPFNKHLVLFVVGKKGGLESLERLLGKSQPPWEKGCIVTRSMQASTCCGTLRGLILQIALKYPVNGTTKADALGIIKGVKQKEERKFFTLGASKMLCLLTFVWQWPGQTPNLVITLFITKYI